MNKTFDLLALSPWLGPSLQPPDNAGRIPALDAKNHVGESLTVFGKIVEAVAHEKLIYLNFEKPFPDTPFMAVVFATKAAQIEGLSNVQGRDAEVTGKIISFRDRAEIVIEKPDQLKLLDPGKPR